MVESKFKLTDEIVEGSNKNLSRLVKKIIEIDYSEILTYDFPLDEAFGLKIFCKGALYCFVVKFSSENKNLICCGPGAHKRNSYLANGELFIPPYIDRWKWHNYFEESYIAYADPMIFWDDEIKLAWLVGDRENWYIENLALIIQKLAQNQNISNNNMVFFGSSGGGFSSIGLGTLIRDSQVLINNSQLFILNYNKDMVDTMFKLIEPEFEGMTREEIINEIKYRLDVIELFKKVEYQPPITYYVNVDSKSDMTCHCIPFIEKIHHLDEFNGLNIIYYRESKKVPHEPIPIDETVEIIKNFCKKNLYNSEESVDDSDKSLIIQN